MSLVQCAKTSGKNVGTTAFAPDVKPDNPTTRQPDDPTGDGRRSRRDIGARKSGMKGLRQATSLCSLIDF